MQRTIQISTPAHNGLYDITRQVEEIVADSGIQTGLVNVYAQGATAAIMILFILMYPLYRSDTPTTLLACYFTSASNTSRVEVVMSVPPAFVIPLLILPKKFSRT